MQVFDILGNHRLLDTHTVDIMLVGGGSIHSGCPSGHLSLLLKGRGKGFSRSE